MGLLSRLKKAWSVFRGVNERESDGYSDRTTYIDLGPSYSGTSSFSTFSNAIDRSILNSVYSRIAIDVSFFSFQHIIVDDDNHFKEYAKTDLDRCLSISANKNQTARDFIRSVVATIIDEGCACVVPTYTEEKMPAIGSDEALMEGGLNIKALAVGKILNWYPDYVCVDLFNDKTGQHEQYYLPKAKVAIIENPMYSIMNERNSIAQRIVRKLNLLDVVDEQTSSGKMDLIIQLPYVIRTQERREQADLRRKEIERQLTNSKYGIAYTDGTEHITQLNRPVENNLLKQIEYLVGLFYTQLGMSEDILKGTANADTMQHYMQRIVMPFVLAITDEFTRKFISVEERKEGQRIKAYSNPFMYIPPDKLSDTIDKVIRNTVLTVNEVRGDMLGMKPSKDPKADQLTNPNISQAKGDNPESGMPVDMVNQGDAQKIQNGENNAPLPPEKPLLIPPL